MDINQNYREAVKTIKEAILRSQYRAATSVNKEQLSLYYGIGRYVSKNSRIGFWGKGAIEQISSLLQKELPGLRGFSTSNIKNMRVFYEEWEPVLNRQPLAGDLVLDEKLLLSVIRQPLADEFNWADFLSIGFSHHTEIISKAKTLEEGRHQAQHGPDSGAHPRFHPRRPLRQHCPRLQLHPGHRDRDEYLRIEVMTTRQRPSLPLAVGRRSEVHDEIATVGFATNDYFLLRETDRHLEFRIIVDVMIIADAWKIVVIHLKLQHDRVRALSIAERPIKIDIAIFRHVFLITPQSSQRTHWLVRETPRYLPNSKR